MVLYNRRLRDALKAVNQYTRTSKGWLGVKCPFCGDSKKAKSVHMYVRIPSDENDNVYALKCFRTNCGYSSIMKPQDLIKFGITDPELFKFIEENYHKSNKMIRVIEKVKNDLILPKEIIKTPAVSSYLNKRTGVDFNDYYIQEKLSFIPDIKKFIIMNQSVIDDSDGLRYIWDNADTSICFLNRTGTRLFARHIAGYKTHSIVSLKYLPDFVSHQPYTIINGVGENDIKGFYYSISEGIFDTINMYLHISGGVNGIFEAAGSASAIKNRFLEGSKYFYDIDWIFGKDSDVDMKFFMKLKSEYHYRFKNKASIVFSENTKDIGDLSECFIPRKKEI